MSQALKTIFAFTKEVKESIIKTYGSLDKFYATVYLIAKNEHYAQMSTIPAAQQRLKTIQAYQGIIRFKLDELGVSGKELMDDIASDYLEDFVAFKEKDFGMTNEEFLAIIKRL